MKKYKTIFIYSIIIFGLMFLTHNLYDWTKITFLGSFFPVNESTMEHMKMIYSTYFIFNFLLYLFRKERLNNFILNSFVSAIFNIIIFLLVYLPIYYTFGENMIFTFILLFISIFITNIISYKILNRTFNKNLCIISSILAISVFILFAYLTFNPPKNPLWLDKQDNIYGFK